MNHSFSIYSHFCVILLRIAKANKRNGKRLTIAVCLFCNFAFTHLLIFYLKLIFGWVSKTGQLFWSFIGKYLLQRRYKNVLLALNFDKNRFCYWYFPGRFSKFSKQFFLEIFFWHFFWQSSIKYLKNQSKSNLFPCLFLVCL